MFPSQICICSWFYSSLFPLMDEWSISSISNSATEYVPLRSWLLQLVHSLLASFYHPKTNYDAFLNPASSSSYYLISLQNLSPNFTTFTSSIYDLSWTHSNQTFIPTASLCHLTISMSLNPVALFQSSLDSTTPFSSWWLPPWDGFSSWLPGHLWVSHPFYQHFSPTSLARSIPSSQPVIPRASG